MNLHSIDPASAEIVLFGMHCRITVGVLSALVESGRRVRAVFLPQRRDHDVHVVIPARNPSRIPVTSLMSPTALPTVASLAWQSGATLVETSKQQLESLPRRFASIRSGVVVCACFPWLLPDEILAAPRQGAFNVHPSLLPDHKGPDPLFWTFHSGATTSGVTIHQMSNAFDAGPILMQSAVPIPLRTKLRDLEDLLIQRASLMVLDALSMIETPAYQMTPQAPSAPEPFPGSDDLIIPSDWPAERAFRFAYGVAPSHGPLVALRANGVSVPVSDAVLLEPKLPKHLSTNQVAIRYSDGIVVYQLAEHL